MTRLRVIPFSLLLCSAFAFGLSAPAVRAWEGDGEGQHPDDGDSDHDGDETSEGASHVRDKLASKFDVDPRVIDRLRDRGLGYGEIDHALTLAERMPDGITRENVKYVLELRQEQHMGWGQIAHELDTQLGAAKREFPTQPPAASVSRPGKSSYAAQGASPAQGLGAKSFSRSGSKGPAKMSGSNAGRMSATRTRGVSGARANGHAFGGGASRGGGGGAASGKAKGRK